ncbi:hypothetical protein ATE84_1437 [Aquimarina sp. MAR_2010_214]|uniref:hypothetical protein n=1 Tax=Aquimarina sp. MAR_2010_214 TaxID=1250026 RepID=UPI000CB75547|nr:hypothetical protein [Aquimarina sp. MAR_2010_214]PKV49414.1 hypothetical protein ATE84_1437 [Aquimarina sp. MAR_2010_214]
MKYILLYSLSLVTIVSCGQKNTKTAMTQYTQQDILDLHKTVEQYTKDHLSEIKRN